MKKIIVFTFVAFLFTTTSCEKYLDTIPDNRTEINTPEKISELLVSAYPSGNYSAFCEIMSDNVSDNFSNSAVNPIYSKPYFWEDVLQLDQVAHALESSEKIMTSNSLTCHCGQR
jgi:hypothetical protein